MMQSIAKNLMENKEFFPALVAVVLFFNDVGTDYALKLIRKHNQTREVKYLKRKILAADEKIKNECNELLKQYSSTFWN